MAPLQTQVLDVRAGGLRYPQPVQREQGDQACSAGGPSSGGDQERAELVAVQGGAVRLVVQPGTVRRHVLDVQRGGPAVPEWGRDTAVAVAVELVLRGAL